jgi:hypothetical protein
MQPKIQTQEVQSLKCVTPQKLTQLKKCLHGMVAEWCGVCNQRKFCSSLITKPIDLLSDKCIFPFCNEEVEQTNNGRGHRNKIYCAEHARYRNGNRDRWQVLKDRIDTLNENEAFAYLNKFRYMGFDGKYEGPSNLCFTVVTGLKKDRGYHAMPIDEHLKPITNPHQITAAELHTLREEERARDVRAVMMNRQTGLSRPQTNYCPHCTTDVEDAVMSLKRGWWIEKGKLVYEDKVVVKKVQRQLKGKYVLQGHVCNG